MRPRPLAVVLSVVATLAACDRSSPEIEFVPGSLPMELTSTAFNHESRIPTRYTCDGAEVSPPLQISWIPPEAMTLALIVEDPDAPSGTWDHWIAYDIDVTASIPEAVASLGTAGRSTGGTLGYESPCPPSGSHRYRFTVYALDTRLGLAAGADKVTVLTAMQGHVLATATLLGRYSR